MLNLTFSINKHYLLVHTLPHLPFPEWENLQDRLWEEFSEAYYLLTAHPEAAFAGTDAMEDFARASGYVPAMLERAFASEEFGLFHAETEDYLKFLEKEGRRCASSRSCLGCRCPRIRFPCL